MIDLVALAVAGLALVAALFTLVTLARLALARRAAPAPGVVAPAPPVLLLRPLDAPTPRELANLATPVAYPGPLEHVVIAPARPEELPAHVTFLRSDPSPDTGNRKVAHLRHALGALPVAGRCVLAIDADVRVDAALVTALATPLAAGACALTTAAPRPLPARGLAARATCALLTATHQSFAALAVMRAGAPAVCGKALGLAPDAQALLAGLEHHVGEDLELATRLHARGLAVALVPTPALVPQDDAVAPSLRAPLERFTRWMLVLRAHRPALYPAVPLLFAPSLPLALLALVIAPRASSPCAALLAASVALLWLARTALALALRAPAARDWPLGEALLLAAFARSLGRRTVTWRGRTFRLGRGGVLTPLAPRADATSAAPRAPPGA